MHAAIPHLIDVQAIDQQIAALRADLESLPKRVQEADARLAGARAEVAAAKEAHTNNAKERKKLELDVGQWKDRAKKYREQTAAVKTNEAYKALLHEIANAEGEAAKAEDAELAIMMAGDDLDRRAKSAEARLREAETVIAAERNQMKARGIEQKKELKPLWPSASKPSLRCPRICGCSTIASPSAITAPRWPACATINAKAVACASCPT